VRGGAFCHAALCSGKPIRLKQQGRYSGNHAVVPMREARRVMVINPVLRDGRSFSHQRTVYNSLRVYAGLNDVLVRPGTRCRRFREVRAAVVRVQFVLVSE